MPNRHLTQKFVDKCQCTVGKMSAQFTDQTVPYLVFQVRANGGRSFLVRYRNQHGRVKSLSIGDAAMIKLSAARAIAKELGSKLAGPIHSSPNLMNAENPSSMAGEMIDTPTVSAFFEGQYLPFARANKKSWSCDVGLFNNHIRPKLGEAKMHEVSVSMVTQMHQNMRADGYAAASCNRVLVLFRYMFNLAIKWEVPHIHKNPSRNIDLFKIEHHKERFLRKDEVERLTSALKHSQNPNLYHIVAFLLLTGARRQEALNAAWEDVDFGQNHWRIPNTKSGRPRCIPLSPPIHHLLGELETKGQSRWLFPNPKTGLPYVSVFSAWNTARQEAGLEDVRIHDLRHSFASFLVNSGRSLYEVKELLGHAHIKTTERYAHLSNETLNDAASTAGNFIKLGSE